MPDLDALLANWHLWRRSYHVERGYARAALLHAPADHDEQLEAERMRLVEQVVMQLPRTEQLAVQHYARAQALGVEVLIHPALLNVDLRDQAVEQAVQQLRRRLLHEGVISP